MESSPYDLDSSQTTITTIKMGIYMLAYMLISTGQLVCTCAPVGIYNHLHWLINRHICSLAMSLWAKQHCWYIVTWSWLMRKDNLIECVLMIKHFSCMSVESVRIDLPTTWLTLWCMLGMLLEYQLSNAKGRKSMYRFTNDLFMEDGLYIKHFVE